MPKKKTEIVPVENKAVQPSENVALQEAMNIESEKRKMIEKYIASNLKSGVDYGTIEITSKKTGKTTETKPTLFKPGSERIASLLKVRAVFFKDTDTYEMLGNPAGAICFLCKLVSIENEKIVVGEGRGVCTVAEKYGDMNNAVKIAEKRAMIDAIIRAAGISDRFTQDLEDMQLNERQKLQPYTYNRTVTPAKTTQPVAKPTQTAQPTTTPVKSTYTPTPVPTEDDKIPPKHSSAKRTTYFMIASKLFGDAEKAKAWVKNAYKVTSFNELTDEQLSLAITKVSKAWNQKLKQINDAKQAPVKEQTQEDLLSTFDGNVPTA